MNRANNHISDTEGKSRPETPAISFGRVNLRHHTYFYDYSHDTRPPPLQVTYLGTIIYPYDSKSYWQRVDSEVFVVEQVTAGNISLLQDGRSYVVGPGEVYLLRKHSMHRFEAGPSRFAHKRFMMIEGEMVDTVLEMTGLAGCDIIRPADPAAVARLIKQAIRVLAQQPEGFGLRLSVIAYELLLLLGRDARPVNRPHELTDALRFLRRCVSTTVTSRQVAEHVHMSVPGLNRLFRKHLDMSPISYLIEQKMAYARQLLATTELPIKSVAWETGYHNPLYFSTQFRKHAGLSPRQYRMQHRGGVVAEGPYVTGIGAEPD